MQADAAEGRGGRADEQRAAAQRENGDAGKGFGVDIPADTPMSRALPMATRAKPTTAKGRVPMRPTRRPAATAPIRRATAGAGRTSRSPAR